MRLKQLAAVFAALALTASAVSCSKKKDTSIENPPYGDAAVFEDEFKDVENMKDGPLLKIKDTTVKPGGVAEVTVSIKNADGKWAMCGLHLVYPDIITPVMTNPDDRTLKSSVGDAAEGCVGIYGKMWRDNLSDILKADHKGSLFFTTMFTGTAGTDGDIATFYLEVPDTVKSGTVLDVDFYYSSTQYARDMFASIDDDKMFEKYAFTHWEGGKITVE